MKGPFAPIRGRAAHRVPPPTPQRHPREGGDPGPHPLPVPIALDSRLRGNDDLGCGEGDDSVASHPFVDPDISPLTNPRCVTTVTASTGSR